jgi:hypothetical protein
MYDQTLADALSEIETLRQELAGRDRLAQDYVRVMAERDDYRARAGAAERERDVTVETLKAYLTLIPEGTDTAAPVPDLREIEKRWLRLCSVCDAGTGGECTCPDGDHHAVIGTLIAEVWRTRKVAADSYHTLCQRFVDEPLKTRELAAAAEHARDAMRPVVEVLALLVALKDGPRDDDYERQKPAAWQTARDALAAAGRGEQ